MRMKSSVDAYVDRGVALLDRERPDWWRYVDASTLDVQDEYSCPLALVLKTDYRSAVRSLGLDDLAAYRHGFNAVWRYRRLWPFAGPVAQLRYRALTIAWRRVVRQRQRAELDRVVASLDERLAQRSA